MTTASKDSMEWSGCVLKRFKIKRKVFLKSALILDLTTKRRGKNI